MIVQQENPLVNISGINVILHDGQTGSNVAQIQSNNSLPHDFTFTGLGSTRKVYYVTLAVERKQTASPAQIPVCPESDPVTFTVRGIPASITFTNARPGTFVLISPSAYVGNNPPPILAGSAIRHYSTVVGADGTTEMDLPSDGTSYFWDCWTPPTTNSTSYNRKTSPSQSIGALYPGDILSVNASACH